MIYGIDISEWQSSIPKFDGDFIMLRAGYSKSIDQRFEDHYKSAISKGLRVGVYWYSYALNIDDAKAEARRCLEVIKDKNISMGVWFDMEDADGYKTKHGFNFNKSFVSDLCNSFCDIIEKAGYYTGIYASLSWIQNYINCPKYDKWVAFWGMNDGKVPSGESKIRKYGSIWQYTSKLNGKNLDGDVLMHDDINMYNVQPKNENRDINGIIEKYRKEVDNLFQRLKEELK